MSFNLTERVPVGWKRVIANVHLNAIKGYLSEGNMWNLFLETANEDPLAFVVGFTLEKEGKIPQQLQQIASVCVAYGVCLGIALEGGKLADLSEEEFLSHTLQVKDYIAKIAEQQKREEESKSVH